MAAKKSAPQWQMDLLGIALSTVGGFLGSLGMTQADLRIQKFEEVPALSPIASFLIGTTIVFLVPKGVKPLGHGFTAVSGGSTADMVINGLSRIEIESGEIDGRLENSEDQINNLTDQNNAIQEAVLLHESEDGTS